MKHISLDHESELIKQFVRSLSHDPQGSVLEISGAPVVQVLPCTEEPIDREKLREALIRRRDASRKLNDEWEHVDREAWDAIEDSENHPE